MKMEEKSSEKIFFRKYMLDGYLIVCFWLKNFPLNYFGGNAPQLGE